MINRVLSGLTPSGSNLHIGNYFGAVKNQIELQSSIPETFYFIADLHALTTVHDKEILQNNIRNVVLDYLSLGIDPDRSIFYRQSDIHEHSELTIVLANYITHTHMQRMHAYKDKLNKEEDVNINMGLFNYPILMASDILLYEPDAIPVGEDQRQHVELARDIAENFNKTYKSEIFKLPEPMISKTVGKIVGTDGKRKMSKSLGNVIGIFDDEVVIKKQIMNCFTDPTRIRSTDPGHVEDNPIFIYHDLLNQDKDEVIDLKNRYEKGEVGDVEVKEKLFKAHIKYFNSAREKRKELAFDPAHIDDLLKDGAEKASVIARVTLKKVYDAIGINDVFI